MKEINLTIPPYSHFRWSFRRCCVDFDRFVCCEYIVFCRFWMWTIRVVLFYVWNGRSFVYQWKKNKCGPFSTYSRWLPKPPLSFRKGIVLFIILDSRFFLISFGLDFVSEMLELISDWKAWCISCWSPRHWICHPLYSVPTYPYDLVHWSLVVQTCTSTMWRIILLRSWDPSMDGPFFPGRLEGTGPATMIDIGVWNAMFWKRLESLHLPVSAAPGCCWQYNREEGNHSWLRHYVVLIYHKLKMWKVHPINCITSFCVQRK